MAPRDPDALLAATLAAIDEDRRPEAGDAFVSLASRALRRERPGGAPAIRPAPLPRPFGPPPREGRPLAEVVDGLSRDLLDGSLWPGRWPMLAAPLPAPLPIAVWSEALIAAMNQSLRLELMSPTGTPIELALVRWMAGLIGWRDAEAAGGTFTSGASESSFSALLAARAAALPAAWSDGIAGEAPVVVATPAVHFSIARALAQIGLGTRSLEVLPACDRGAVATALERRLDELARSGRRVMAVVATSGAYISGAFDDLRAIGEICRARGTWLHVDAAIGGAALLSAVHRPRLDGIELASSVAWDLHKLLQLPLQAAVLLVRDERDLERAFGPPASGDTPYVRSPDQCHRSFQNSRRFDALKLWIALQRHGAAGLGALYDRLCELARELHRQVAARPELEPLLDPESSLLVFRYVGDRRLVGRPLDLLNQEIFRAAARERLAVMTFARYEGRIGFAVSITDPFLQPGDLAALLDRLIALGAAARIDPAPPEARP